MKQNPCVVIGAGGHARAVISILFDLGFDRTTIVGVIDASSSEVDLHEEIMGIRVFPGLEPLKVLRHSAALAYLAVGQSAHRQAAAKISRELGYALPNAVAPSAVVDRSAALGLGNIVAPLAFIGPLARIGNCNIVNTHSVIEHECIAGDFCHIAPMGAVAGRVQLGDRVFIGLGARVIDKLKVTCDVTLGAGAVAIRDIDQPGTYVGVPARRIVT